MLKKVREIVRKYVKDKGFKSLEKDRKELCIMNPEDHHSPYLKRGRSTSNENQRRDRDPFSLSYFAEFADVTASPRSGAHFVGHPKVY